VIEEVIKLLLFLEEFKLDDIAIKDLLTTRQRRYQQNADAPALLESQVEGKEIEQYNNGLLTLGPSTLEGRDGRN
jgi:hypothetical protein